MDKTTYMKAWLMVFLIVTMPITIPVVVADTPPPGDQCDANVQEGQEFVDFMDGGIIKTLETVSAALFGIATVVNTIDYFMTLKGSIIGLMGPDGSVCCPSSAFGPPGAAACKSEWIGFGAWTKIKNSGILTLITNFATCACCSGGKTSGVGGNFGVCPLGNLADKLGDSLPGLPLNAGGKTDSNGKLIPGSQWGADEGLFETNEKGKSGTESFLMGGPKGKGIGQLHISAFDNIYTAIGCLCPVAILFNLRKLKTIYQVNNCCVEEACKNGQSTEACSRQLDEALCMYWDGALWKTLITVVASIVAGYITKMIWKKIGDSMLVKCVLLGMEIIGIPGRVQAVLGAFDWLSKTFEEPTCEDLGFDQIDDMFGSGVMSANAGITQTTLNDNDGDGRYDSSVNSYDKEEVENPSNEIGQTALDKMGYKKDETTVYALKDGNNVIGYEVRDESGILGSVTSSFTGGKKYDSSGNKLTNEKIQQIITQNQQAAQMAYTVPAITVDGKPLDTNTGLGGKTIVVPDGNGGTRQFELKSDWVNGDGSGVSVEVNGGTITVNAPPEKNGQNPMTYERTVTSEGALMIVKENRGDTDYIKLAQAETEGTIITASNFKDENAPESLTLAFSNGKQATLQGSQAKGFYDNVLDGKPENLPKLATITQQIKATAGFDNVVFDETTGDIVAQGEGVTTQISIQNGNVVASTTRGSIKETATFDGDTVKVQVGGLDGTSTTVDKIYYQNNLAGKVESITGSDVKLTNGNTITVGNNGNKFTTKGPSGTVLEIKEITPASDSNDNLRQVTVSNGDGKVTSLTMEKPGEKVEFSQSQLEKMGITKSDGTIDTTVNTNAAFEAYQTLTNMGYSGDDIGKGTSDNSWQVDHGDNERTTYTQDGDDYTILKETFGDADRQAQSLTGYHQAFYDKKGDISSTKGEDATGSYLTGAITRNDDGSYTIPDYTATLDLKSEEIQSILGELDTITPNSRGLAFKGLPNFRFVNEDFTLQCTDCRALPGESSIGGWSASKDQIFIADKSITSIKRGTENNLWYTVEGTKFKVEGDRLVDSNGDDFTIEGATADDFKNFESKLAEFEKKNGPLKAWLNKNAKELKETDKAKEAREAAAKAEAEKKKQTVTVQAQKDAISQRVAYAAVWQLTNFMLQEFAYPYIDEMCVEDWEASEPAGNNEDTSGGSGTGGPSGIQQNTNNNVGNSTQQTQTPPCSNHTVHIGMTVTNNSGIYNHDIEYTIIPCNALLQWNLYGQEGSNPPNGLDNGATSSPIQNHHLVFNLSLEYDKACLNIPAIGQDICSS